ncbi:hypothetical protein PENTCL1PPCAC_4179, partial [Pristionchus entomophagus]
FQMLRTTVFLFVLFTVGGAIPWPRRLPGSRNQVEAVFECSEMPSRINENEIREKTADCGNNFACKSGQTCCELLDDNDGPFRETFCCPIANAVCCDHGCCRRGWTCSRDGRSCVRPAFCE